MKENKTLLIVEDEETIGHILRQALTAYGYKVVTVSTVKEALEYYEMEKPDGMILDMLLPDGTGKDVFEPNGAETPTIVTSILPRESVSEMLGTKKFLFLSKPFDITQMLHFVDDAFGKKPE